MATKTAGQTLAEWRASKKKSQTECAKAVGARQATWSEWESGPKQPQIRYAIRIERLTEGAVPVTSWEPTEPTHQPGVAEDEEEEPAAAEPTFPDSDPTTQAQGVA